MDMHSGGGRKLQWNYIYIEADEQKAIYIFERMFGLDPYNVTCNCCGEDYSISSDKLGALTSYERRCRYNSQTRKYTLGPNSIKLGDYLKNKDCKFIFADEVDKVK